MHEVIHTIEKWAGIEFSEENVERCFTNIASRPAKRSDQEFEMPGESAEGATT